MVMMEKKNWKDLGYRVQLGDIWYVRSTNSLLRNLTVSKNKIL